MVGVETVQDQARAAINATPTEFEVTLMKDESAWDRARYFLASFTASGVRVNDTGSGGKLRLSNASLTGSSTQNKAPDKFEYLIEKQRKGAVYLYRVQCRATGQNPDAAAALRNARNLSRFIADGSLEVSLLVR